MDKFFNPTGSFQWMEEVLFSREHLEADVIGDLTVFGHSASAKVGTVVGDVKLRPLADGFEGEFGKIVDDNKFGEDGGDLEIIDAWDATIVARSVGGEVRVVDSRGADVTVLGSVSKGIEVEDSSHSTFDIGQTRDAKVENSDDIVIDVFDGRWGDFEIEGNDNVLNVFDGRYADVEIEGGFNNSVDFFYVEGASFFISRDAVGTSVVVEEGSSRVRDRGEGSMIQLGTGDDTVFAYANDGNPVINTGAGDDTVIKRGDADTVFKFGKGYDYFEFNPLESGHTVLLDSPEGGWVDFGPFGVTLDKFVWAFGEETEHDHTFVDLGNDASLTIVGVADTGSDGLVDFGLGKG